MGLNRPSLLMQQPECDPYVLERERLQGDTHHFIRHEVDEPGKDQKVTVGRNRENSLRIVHDLLVSIKAPLF